MRKIPVVNDNDRLKIWVRCFKIWSWRSFNIFVGMLLGPVDLLLLREEIILEIWSSVIWLNMMDSWILGGKKSEKESLENFILDCNFWATVEKKSLKTLTIERGSASLCFNKNIRGLYFLRISFCFFWSVLATDAATRCVL